MTLLLDATLRSSLILLVGLSVHAVLRRRSAAARHAIVAATIFAAAAVVPLGWILPAWDVPLSPRTAEHAEAAPEPPVAPTIRVRAAPSETSGATALPLVAIIWAAGVLVSAVVLVAGLGRVVLIAARAERAEDGPWARLAQRVSASYGLRCGVTVLHTDDPGMLATWGLFRPRVLLPADARAWPEDRVYAVLCHELAHIRRHDWLVQTGAEAMRVVYWFNPLLWMACARLRRESEQACDDAVVGAGVPAWEYARHLLDIAKTCRRSGPACASAMPMARPCTLERRIAAMLTPGIDRGTPSRRAAATAAALLLTVTSATAAFRASQNAPLPLAGSVYDTSGAVLPEAALTLEDAQQSRWRATTDAAGRFEFPPMPPGRYVLEASLIGFRPLRHEFELRTAADWDRAITLQVGDLTETVKVRERRVSGPSSQPLGAQPVRIGGNIRPPRKLNHVRPEYPAAMRDAGREGVVPLEAVIGRDGAVLSVRVLSAQVHPDFVVAAVDAVRQWRFDATLLNGVPVEVRMTVSVEFSLSE